MNIGHTWNETTERQTGMASPSCVHLMHRIIGNRLLIKFATQHQQAAPPVGPCRNAIQAMVLYFFEDRSKQGQRHVR
jgi:hypothetical protein